jgi:hypothetical protein
MCDSCECSKEIMTEETGRSILAMVASINTILTGVLDNDGDAIKTRADDVAVTVVD